MEEYFNPFHLPLKPAWLARSIEKLLSLDILAKCYEGRPTKGAAVPSQQLDDFLSYTLDALNINLQVQNPEALDNIPESGPTMFIANHPLGGLEGVAMTQMLRRVRPDLKVLTNEVLTRIPEFADVFIGVDVLSQNAAEKNMQGMRQVLKHLKKGGALLIYPAGMVSAINTGSWKIEDRQWSNVVGKLVKQFKATCVPFYVHGRNSKRFYLAGLIHPRLRTAMLPRELANKARRDTSITVGSPITWKDIQELDNSDSITSYLRTATEFLSKAKDKEQGIVTSHPPLESVNRSSAELQRLKNDLAGIEEHRLLQYREFDVYCAPYAQLGSIMDEIAVARERTFRAAGEGTGHAQDRDHFDPHYLHLFIWDTEKSTIVGGYRVGRADEIIESLGVDGLYSRSLYQFDESYIQRIGGALEVGRSFVTQEYQRHPKALDLLWQGLGRWVVANEGYHTLFGCVSISAEHSARARGFLSDSLMSSFRAEQEYLIGVEPVAPLKVRNRIWTDEVLTSLSNITLINKLLGQCDPGKSVPILLRQYLALNGRFIGFSVNHNFNQSLDGLIMVDLRKTSMRYLQRYLGKSGSETFIKYWSAKSAAA